MIKALGVYIGQMVGRANTDITLAVSLTNLSLRRQGLYFSIKHLAI